MPTLRTLLALVAGCVLTLSGSPAQAHSGSYDLKYVDGSNLILVTFNTHEPVSGLDVVHNIRLYDLVGAPIPYDEVHVEVSSRDETEGPSASGSSVISDETLPMLPTNESKHTFAYPVSGSYTLAAEFAAGGREISRAEFAVEVGKGSTEESSGFGLLPFAGAFLLGVAVMVPFLLRRPAAQAQAQARAESPPVRSPGLPARPSSVSWRPAEARIPTPQQISDRYSAS